MGARPLARLIQETIKKPLAEEVLFGKLMHGGAVKVILEGTGAESKLTFEFPAGPIKPKPEKVVTEPREPKAKAPARPKAKKPVEKPRKLVVPNVPSVE